MSTSFSYKVECSNNCPLEYSSNIFESFEKKMNILPVRDNSYWVRVNFHYQDDKYTEVTQSPQYMQADVISNTGGVLGLFLELSFYAAVN